MHFFRRPKAAGGKKNNGQILKKEFEQPVNTELPFPGQALPRPAVPQPYEIDSLNKQHQLFQKPPNFNFLPSPPKNAVFDHNKLDNSSPDTFTPKTHLEQPLLKETAQQVVQYSRKTSSSSSFNDSPQRTFQPKKTQPSIKKPISQTSGSSSSQLYSHQKSSKSSSSSEGAGEAFLPKSPSPRQPRVTPKAQFSTSSSSFGPISSDTDSSQSPPSRVVTKTNKKLSAQPTQKNKENDHPVSWHPMPNHKSPHSQDSKLPLAGFPKNLKQSQLNSQKKLIQDERSAEPTTKAGTTNFVKRINKVKPSAPQEKDITDKKSRRSVVPEPHVSLRILEKNNVPIEKKEIQTPWFLSRQQSSSSSMSHTSLNTSEDTQENQYKSSRSTSKNVKKLFHGAQIPPQNPFSRLAQEKVSLQVAPKESQDSGLPVAVTNSPTQMLETAIEKITQNSMATLSKDLNETLRHQLVQYLQQEFVQFETRSQVIQEKNREMILQYLKENTGDLKKYCTNFSINPSHVNSQKSQFESLLKDTLLNSEHEKLDALQEYIKSMSSCLKNFEKMVTQQYAKQQSEICLSVGKQLDIIQRVVTEELQKTHSRREEGYRTIILQMKKLLKKKKEKIRSRGQSLHHLLYVNTLVKQKIQEMEEEGVQLCQKLESNERTMQYILSNCVFLNDAKKFASRALFKGVALEHFAAHILKIRRTQTLWALYKIFLHKCFVTCGRFFMTHFCSSHIRTPKLPNSTASASNLKTPHTLDILFKCSRLIQKLTFTVIVHLSNFLCSRTSKNKIWAFSRLLISLKNKKVLDAQENSSIFFVFFLNSLITTFLTRHKYYAFLLLYRFSLKSSFLKGIPCMDSRAYTLKYDEGDFLKWLPRTNKTRSIIDQHPWKPQHNLPRHYLLVDSLITTNTQLPSRPPLVPRFPT